MLIPVPGFSYIKFLSPPPPPEPALDAAPSPAGPLCEADGPTAAEARKRMRIILDVLFRVRPLHHLDRAGLSPLCAKLLRRRMLQHPLPPAPVRLNRTFVRPAVDGADYEVYGSCTSAERTYAFIATFGPPAELLAHAGGTLGEAAARPPVPAAQDPAFWHVRTFRVL